MRRCKTLFNGKAILFTTTLSIIIFASCQKDVQQTSSQEESGAVRSAVNAEAEAQSQQDYMPNELLVKFSNGQSENGRANALARIGGSVSEKILTKAMTRVGDNDGIYLIHTPLAVLEAINKIKGITV